MYIRTHTVSWKGAFGVAGVSLSHNERLLHFYAAPFTLSLSQGGNSIHVTIFPNNAKYDWKRDWLSRTKMRGKKLEPASGKKIHHRRRRLQK